MFELIDAPKCCEPIPELMLFRITQEMLGTDSLENIIEPD
jgi:hypothetical protein